MQLSPATTGISFGASEEGIALANIYNYTLLTSTNAKHLTTQMSGGITYYYYPSLDAALLDLNGTAAKTVFVALSSGNCTDNHLNNFTSTAVNSFTFQSGGVSYTGCTGQDVAFTFPLAGDSLVGRLDCSSWK